MMAKSEKKEKNSRKKRKSLPERIDLLPVEEDQKSFKIYSCKSMIAYKLSGSQIVKFSSQNNLEMVKEEIRKAQQGNTKDEQDEKEVIKFKRKRNIRYFDQLKSIKKCYRCGQQGHFTKDCPRIHAQCLYCFGNHIEDNCCDVYCQNCSVKGHQQQFCEYRGRVCQKCWKVGHDENQCKSIVVLNRQKNKQMLEGYSKDDLSLLTCMNCGSTECDHFNCFQYKDQLENVYMNNFILD